MNLDILKPSRRRSLPQLVRTIGLSGSAAGSLGASIVSQLALFVSGVLYARLLGPEQRGQFALFTLISSVLTIVTLIGSNTAITYFVARTPDRVRAITRIMLPVISVQIAVALLVHLIILVLLLRGPFRGEENAAFLSLAGAPCSIVQQYGLATLQGLRRFRLFNIARLLPAGINSLLLIVAAIGGSTLTGVLIAWALANVTTTVIILIATHKATRSKATQPDDRPSPATKSQILRFGARGFLGSASPLETFRLDQMAVALFLTPIALGVYVTALAFTNAPRLVAQSLGMVALPVIASQRGHNQATTILWRYVGLTVAGSSILALALAANAARLIPLIFGSDYSDAVRPMQILLVSSVILASRRILAEGLRGLGYPGVGSVAEVASWLVFIPLLWILAARWELTGVSIAMVASSSISLAVMLVAAMRVLHSRSVSTESPAI